MVLLKFLTLKFIGYLLCGNEFKFIYTIQLWNTFSQIIKYHSINDRIFASIFNCSFIWRIISEEESHDGDDDDDDDDCSYTPWILFAVSCAIIAGLVVAIVLLYVKFVRRKDNPKTDADPCKTQSVAFDNASPQTQGSEPAVHNTDSNIHAHVYDRTIIAMDQPENQYDHIGNTVRLDLIFNVECRSTCILSWIYIFMILLNQYMPIGKVIAMS